MTNYDATSGAGTLRLIVTQASQNIPANQSTVNWELHLYCYNGASYNLSPPTSYSVTINGTAYTGTYTFDFRSYSDKLIASGSTVVTHDADGTKTISVSGYTAHTGTGAIGGPITASGSFALTTIPRATTPTVSPTSGNTGSAYTITHTPASSSFYHDVAYSLDGGGSYTNIVTNVVGTTTTTSWTPAHTLLPNASSVTAIVRLITRDSSGGTIIGTNTVNLPLTVPSSVKPTVSSVAWTDGQVSSPDMPTLMGGSGRFVQRWSKLIPTVTSAGASGSTITDTDTIQNGQTTDSGTAFANPITLSGAVPYTTYAYDTRSRTSDPYVNTVAVTAYNYPNLPVPTVTRTSDAAGLVPDPTGTYLAITPNASTSSLNFSGEKNLLEWQVRTRLSGGSWTTVQAWTSATVSGVTWTTKKVVAGYASSSEWEVEVSIRDLFGKNGFSTSQTVVTQTVIVPSESVVFDWDEDLGFGFGEYRRPGYRASFNGDIYINGAISQSGNAVIDAGDAATTAAQGVVELATSAETIAGTDVDRAVTPAGLAAKVSSATEQGLVELATNAESLTGTDTARAVTPDDLKYTLDRRVSALQVVPSAISVTGGSGSVSATGEVTITGACTQVIIQGAFPTPYRDFYLEWTGVTSASTALLARLAVTTTPITTTTYSSHSLGGQNATTYPTENANSTSFPLIAGTTHAMARAWFSDPNTTGATQVLVVGGYGGQNDATIQTLYGRNSNATAYASLVILVASGTFTGRFRIHAVPV